MSGRVMGLCLAFASALHGNAASGEPLKLLGLTAKTNFSQGRSILIQRGYNCDTKIEDLILGEKDTCLKGDAKVRFGAVLLASHRNEISFSCENFNVCRYSDEQIMNFLMESLPIIEVVKVPSLFAKALSEDDEYCGYGTEGDAVCVDVRSIYLRESSNISFE